MCSGPLFDISSCSVLLNNIFKLAYEILNILVEFTTICAISAYHHYRCEFEPRSLWCVLHTTCDKVNQWLATGRWFSSGTPVFSINKTDHHDITEILLEVALNTINTKIYFTKTDRWCRGITVYFSYIYLTHGPNSQTQWRKYIHKFRLEICLSSSQAAAIYHFWSDHWGFIFNLVSKR
jgi:hypothetical protein